MLYYYSGVHFGGNMELYTACIFCIHSAPDGNINEGELAPIQHSLSLTLNTRARWVFIGFICFYQYKTETLWTSLLSIVNCTLLHRGSYPKCLPAQWQRLHFIPLTKCLSHKRMQLLTQHPTANMRWSLIYANARQG